jgi:hypothetical protein
MFSWLAKKPIALNMAGASAGDIGPTLRLDADDARFRFAGNSSWGGELDEYLASAGDPLSQQATGGSS